MLVIGSVVATVLLAADEVAVDVLGLKFTQEQAELTSDTPSVHAAATSGRSQVSVTTDLNMVEQSAWPLATSKAR